MSFRVKIIIGENSIVGANSVITKSFPKNSVIAGNPAKLIRTLD
jgi:acetyltransferase-like isoleucine patch superfamily enzyme